MVVDGGKLLHTLNVSTGGGYTYVDQGVTSVATTPSGVFHIYNVIDGLDVDSLGALWRPRFFYGGFAVHGDSYVPPFPDSHGCVRVSDEAINWIWADEHHAHRYRGLGLLRPVAGRWRGSEPLRGARYCGNYFGIFYSSRCTASIMSEVNAPVSTVSSL